jgi:hypothetical protein
MMRSALWTAEVVLRLMLEAASFSPSTLGSAMIWGGIKGAAIGWAVARVING